MIASANPSPVIVPASGIAAFFDLDGTLISEPSLELRFFRALRRNNEIPIANYFRWAFESGRLFPTKGLAAIRHANKKYLANISRDLVYRYLDEIPIFTEAIARILWHARQNHQLVLVTGTLEPLAQMAASALECELEARGVETKIQVCAAALEVRHGLWTGKLLGPAMYGAAKSDALRVFARSKNISLRDSHAYGNSVSDGHMLGAVGHAHAVNPGKDLASLANLYDWPVWHWHNEKIARPAPLAALETNIPQPETHS
jgi:putative phosphoserine phosphatase / 1-acylglycerol-3-phosphate O-acyltransferase